MEVTVPLRYDAADHDVCRKSWIRGRSAERWTARHPGNDHDRRYSSVYPVREKFHTADPADRTGHQPGAVDGGSVGACL